MDKRDASKLSPANLQAFQDAYHRFERGGEVTLDGRDLDKAMQVNGIQLTDEEIDEVLTILSNHDESIDIYEFCYLTNSAAIYLGNLKKGFSDKKIILSLKQFLQKAAASCAPKRHSWARKSADTLGFYFEGARINGLTERQLAERACSLDTTGTSPYKQPIVLPGLPADDHSKGSSRVNSLAPCTILPPSTYDEHGKRLSKCTVLPYTSCRPKTARGNERSIFDEAKPTPKYRPIPYSLVLEAQKNANESELKKKVKPQIQVDKPKGKDKSSEKFLPIVNIEGGTKREDSKMKKCRFGGPNIYAHRSPLPFKMPKFPDVEGRFVTFEELAELRDQIIMVRENHRKKMRTVAAKRIISAIPSESYRKQFKSTIKAYFG